MPRSIVLLDADPLANPSLSLECIEDMPGYEDGLASPVDLGFGQELFPDWTQGMVYALGLESDLAVDENGHVHPAQGLTVAQFFDVHFFNEDAASEASTDSASPPLSPGGI